MLLEHAIEIRVRYCETDAQGFVHHANYLNYFEMGRTELFRAGGGDYRAMEEGGLFFVVARLNCAYRSPARYDDVLALTTRIARITAAKLEHDYELRRGSDLIATAHTVLACIDRRGAVQRIPERLSEAWESASQSSGNSVLPNNRTSNSR